MADTLITELQNMAYEAPTDTLRKLPLYIDDRLGDLAHLRLGSSEFKATARAVEKANNALVCAKTQLNVQKL